MPTKKQRRRREKGRRHEYEYVYVDDEGHELPPEEVEQAAVRNGGSKKQPAAKGSRRVRALQPPSWRRVGKRALLFAPFMFILISVLSPELTTAQTIAQTAFLLLIFLPFSYVMDSITYRMVSKRQAKLEGGASPPAEKREG